MESWRISVACFLLLAVYATQTVAIQCVQTECDTSKGGYCCKKDESAKTKACCCIYNFDGGFSQNCVSHTGPRLPSFPPWAGIVIGLVVMGIIGGVIVGVVLIRRRRQAYSAM